MFGKGGSRVVHRELEQAHLTLALEGVPQTGVALREREAVDARQRGVPALPRQGALDHGLGLYTLYFHLDRVDVAEGAAVERLAGA